MSYAKLQFAGIVDDQVSDLARTFVEAMSGASSGRGQWRKVLAMTIGIAAGFAAAAWSRS